MRRERVCRCVIVTLVVTSAVWPNAQAAAAKFSLQDGTLALGDRAVLKRVPETLMLVDDPTGAGVFLRFAGTDANSVLHCPIGAIDGMKRFTSCRRDEPWWMLPATGTTSGDVQLETQWLLAETESDDCVMLVPLMDGPFVFTLCGDPHGLWLTGETASPSVKGTGGVALFVSVGRDPYALADAGAKAVMKHLGTGRLRQDKPTPDFVDTFGWCTWDSFYKDVSADGVKRGLASFAAGGVEPRFIILDDGWQDYKRMPTGEDRLVSLSPNQARFGGDLTPVVRLAKEDFKIRTFLVWHALTGYWGGVDGNSLPGYDVRDVQRSFSSGILHYHANLNSDYWGRWVGVIPPTRIAKFYSDYYRRLREQGVDGVKVDNQSMLEGVAADVGGRVALTRAYRAALEESAAAHFNGRVINCMACAMETFYGAPMTTLMRTSIDFWPKRPETHGQHLFTNALVGLWFGEFMQPDWDMFQSGHAMGSFHAAGRAVSGGPVYVSDTPDGHDFTVLRKLVLSDGFVLRADDVGRPTRDCLFADVTRDPVLLKVFNANGDCGVIGVFNCNYHAAAAEKVALDGTVSPSDVQGLHGDDFVAFAQQGNRLWRCKRFDRAPIKLAEGGWEIVSFAPVDRDISVLGLADKLNSTAAVVAKSWGADGALAITLRDGGRFLAWAARAPRTIEVGGRSIAFTHDAASGRLSALLPATGTQTIVLRW
jgi:raffinose synthase